MSVIQNLTSDIAYAKCVIDVCRVMDEFDVFMDAMSRNIAIKSVIDFADQFDQRQFIFITPQVGLGQGKA